MSLFNTYMVNIIFHNHTPLRFVSLPVCFPLCNMCAYACILVHSCMCTQICAHTVRVCYVWGYCMCVYVCACVHMRVSLSVSAGLAALKWQRLINGARLCPWFVCFLLIITNMGWNIWVTKIDIMTECALLSSSYIRLANFWGKAKCLGNITSHLSSPSH